MRRHATMGGRTLRDIARRGGDNPFIETAYEVAMYHHERWDGSGYPFAIPGPHIPIAARIVALADVYDALTSKRCYKPAFSHAEARTYIIEQSGRHFDPEVVEAFLARELDFVRIREALTGDLPIESADLPSSSIRACAAPPEGAAAASRRTHGSGAATRSACFGGRRHAASRAARHRAGCDRDPDLRAEPAAVAWPDAG
jgi:hypothetical protein